MELLLRRLGAQRDEVSFAMVGSDISASWPEGEGSVVDREARVELARQAILDLVIESCERAPELESDWFAVSYVG